MSEDKLQSSIWIKAWNEYPEARRCMWAVPNGGVRNQLEAIKLKATGVLPGVFDMHLYWQNQLYCFEFKVGYNNLSDHQIQWQAAIEKQGAKTFLIRSEEEFFNIFTMIIRHERT